MFLPKVRLAENHGEGLLGAIEGAAARARFFSANSAENTTRWLERQAGTTRTTGRHNLQLLRRLRRLRSFDCLRRVDEHDGRSLLYVVAQQGGVPIRQPDATMGFGFADLGGIRRAMDAIALRR